MSAHIQSDVVAFAESNQGLGATLVFADPPYNLRSPSTTLGRGIRDKTREAISWDVYNDEKFQDFTWAWLESIKGVLNNHGTLAVIGSYHNIHNIGYAMSELGYWILNEIVWHKTNAMPNFSGTRMSNNCEFILWAKPSEKGKHVYNNQEMKRYNNGKQLTSLWSIPVCSGNERIRISNLDKRESFHPTQKPLELLHRVIEMATRKGDLVVDLFGGTGTASIAAHRLQRQFVYVDNEPRYVAMATNRYLMELANANTD